MESLQPEIKSIISNTSLSKKEQFYLLSNLFVDSGIFEKEYSYYKAGIMVYSEWQKRTYRCAPGMLVKYTNNKVYLDNQKEISRGRLKNKLIQSLERRRMSKATF